MEAKFKRVVVKIGSNVLTQKDGTLDTARMESLVNQVAQLHQAGVEVILVSSGAVASGRSEMKLQKKLDPVSARQLFSAVGQAKLINRYYELFAKHGMICGQVLTTKDSFGTRIQYLTQKDCMSVMLDNKVVPIVNENDTISVTELMFTDNDELSGLLATMMQAEALIILSNIDGIYDGDPNLPESKVITEIAPKRNLSKYIQTGKSSFGRGGMLTKCNIARKVAEEGITVMIANGKREGILLDLIDKNSQITHTTFIANEREASGVKKWIAHSESFAKGRVIINQGAAEALLSDKAHSLLFIGITSIEGSFEKGDIVKITTQDGTELGVGKAQMDSEKATANIGKKGLRPFVHYNYLYLI